MVCKKGSYVTCFTNTTLRKKLVSQNLLSWIRRCSTSQLSRSRRIVQGHIRSNVVTFGTKRKRRTGYWQHPATCSKNYHFANSRSRSIQQKYRQTIQCFCLAMNQVATAQIVEPIAWKKLNEWLATQTNGNGRTRKSWWHREDMDNSDDTGRIRTILLTMGGYGQFWWQWADTDNFDDTGQIQIILMTLDGYGQFWWH